MPHGGKRKRGMTALRMPATASGWCGRSGRGTRRVRRLAAAHENR